MDKIYIMKSLALEFAAELWHLSNSLSDCAHGSFDSDAILEEIQDVLQKLPRVTAKFKRKCEKFSPPPDAAQGDNE